MMNFRYYPNNQIDKKRWDRALTEMENTLIYPYSYYLDAVTQNQWGAYIGDDYSMLFPVLLRNRFLFKDIRQPLFTQQLGIFSGNTLPQQDIKPLLDAIASRAHLVNIQTHQFMPIENHEAFTVMQRKNYQLELNKNYTELKSGFSSNTKRNVNKSLKINQTIKNINIDEFLQYYSGFQKKMGLKKHHLDIFRQLLNVLNEKEQIVLKAVVHESKITAVAGWCLTNNRIYYLAGASDEKGMQNRSMFLLQNLLIEQFAGRNIIYDFEGSMVEGVARFFAGFGAKPVVYYHLYKNNLPFFLKRFF